MMLRALLIAALLALSVPLHAEMRTEDQDIVNSSGFMRGHPDLRWRLYGLDHYKRGEHAQALKYFRRAARYSDKPSQGMVAQMYWRGEGVDADPALAYAWMDLAAERHYRVMLIQREIYWDALTEDQRARAVSEGQALYAEFGDAVAERRLHAVMRRNGKSTGSRTGGSVGNLQVVLMTPTGTVTVDGSKFYHPDYWEPERYRQWQDRDWKDLPQGRVEIGPLQSGEAVPPLEETPKD